MQTPVRLLAALLGVVLLLPLAACATTPHGSSGASSPPPFANAYPAPGDTGERASLWYYLHRAWVQLTRDLSTTELPATVPLDARELERHRFAVAWLGHATLLVHAGSSWILIDPALLEYVGPVWGFGPARLTDLPIAPEALPHVDVVLISHDHHDHLDLPSVRHLAGQPGGPPRFLVGRGLRPWFEENVAAPVEELDWYEHRTIGDVDLTFVPAQHSSGRSLGAKNGTLWGGWVVALGEQRFYFPGDTAYVEQLFKDIRARVREIQLAAIPIGAYTPRKWMRFEHLDPDEAVRAHLDVGAIRSFGVHWATFQLGDEEPYQPALDLVRATKSRSVEGFGTVAIGRIVDVPAPSLSSPVLVASPAQ
jgi:N-acyl-phosphatidylethanolamine-hydrolysing phospholipase D